MGRCGVVPATKALVAAPRPARPCPAPLSGGYFFLYPLRDNGNSRFFRDGFRTRIRSEAPSKPCHAAASRDALKQRAA